MLARVAGMLRSLPSEPGHDKGRQLFLAARRCRGVAADELVISALVEACQGWRGWSQKNLRRCVNRGLHWQPGSQAQEGGHPTPTPIHQQRWAERLWQATVPVGDDAFAQAGLRDLELLGNQVDVVAGVEGQDLARALEPEPATCLKANFQGKPWPSIGYSLILPMWNEDGVLSSLRARYLGKRLGTSRPKAVSRSGTKQVGLILANPKALGWLRGESDGREFWVVEGETDFLSLAVDRPNLTVIGILSGSWSSAFARKIPDGSEVHIATDPDAAGDKYAKEVMKSLTGREIAVERWRPRRRR